MPLPDYRDFWTRIGGSLLVSHFIESLGRDQSLLVLLQRDWYYVALASGSVIAFVVWTLIRALTIRLDTRYDWFAQALPRITLQLAGGVMLPSLLAYLLTTVQMRVFFAQDILLTTYLHTEFPVVVLLLLLINLYYFTSWLYHYWRLAQPTTVTRAEPDSTSLPLVVGPTDSHQTAGPGRTRTLLVAKGGQTIVLTHDEVAYLFRSGDYNYIRTCRNEDYLTTQTLDELTATLSESDFFRVNRQLTAHRRACHSFRTLDFGKLQLDLDPPYAEPVVVSQKRAKAFREWLAGQPAV